MSKVLNINGAAEMARAASVTAVAGGGYTLAQSELAAFGVTLTDWLLIISVAYAALQFALVSVKIPALIRFWWGGIQGLYARWKARRQKIEFPTIPSPLEKDNDTTGSA